MFTAIQWRLKRFWWSLCCRCLECGGEKRFLGYREGFMVEERCAQCGRQAFSVWG